MSCHSCLDPVTAAAIPLDFLTASSLLETHARSSDGDLMNLRPGRRTALCMLPREIKSNQDWYRRCLWRLLELARDGEIVANTGPVFPLGKAAEVHAALHRRELTGKIVLTTT